MRFSLAIVACLTVGMVLMLSGTGLAISGLASPGPAVNAQYPDAANLSPGGAAAQPARLVDLRRAARQHPIPPAEQAAIKAGVLDAVTESSPGVREYGSIPLIVGAILFAVGWILRSRRTAPSL
jgi:hypothetical protein